MIALLTLMLFVIEESTRKDTQLFHVISSLPSAAVTLLIFSNTSLFFQDWIMFLGVENSQLTFTTNFAKSEIVLASALLVPQAWTLGVELTFYLVAPFFLRRKNIVLLLLMVSILIRIGLLYIGLGRNDPWTYRFFPAELAFFLVGAIAHQYISPFYSKMLSRQQIGKWSNFLTLSFIIFSLSYSLIPVNGLIKSGILFMIFFFTLPLIFVFQMHGGWDKWLGELSYPIYICHMFVIYLVTFFYGGIEIGTPLLGAVIILILSVFFSIILNSYITRRVEIIRNRFRYKNSIVAGSYHG